MKILVSDCVAFLAVTSYQLYAPGPLAVTSLSAVCPRANDSTALNLVLSWEKLGLWMESM